MMRSIPIRTLHARVRYSSSSALTSIQTSNWKISPTRATKLCAAGAAASFGFSSMLGLLVSTLLEKIGLETDPGFKMIALSPILLSSFKMDLSLRATVEGEEQADCIFTLLNGNISGTSLYPLSHLSTNINFDDPPIPFLPSIHSSLPTFEDSESSEITKEIKIIPFNTSPINFVEKNVKSIPKIEKDGFYLDPSKIKEILFATYPVYVPAYLSEFESQDERRVTVVCFAASERPAFSVFPTFKESPVWEPRSSSLFSFGVYFYNSMVPSPVIASISESLTSAIARAGEIITSFEEIEKSKSVMKYEFHDMNKKYIECSQQVLAHQEALKNFESLPEGAKALIVSKSGIKLVDSDEAVADAEETLKKSKAKLLKLKPDWMK